MKFFFFILLPTMFCGCINGLTGQQVDFVYFNLSTNRITVLIDGLPAQASPGVLVPVTDENNRLREKSFTFFESVKIKDRINIRWQENGTSHQVELKRDDLGLPAKVSSGRIRFTYLGNDKWRVTRLKGNI